MKNAAKELGRFARALIWKGAAIVMLGFAALVWSEQLLIAAMIAVGIVATLFGLYEMATAIAIRGRASHWWLVLAHGAASFVFGLLSVGAPGVSLRISMLVVASWLALYGALMWAAAAQTHGLPSVRRALLVFGFIDVALALFSMVYPGVTIFWLLFFGAAYAVVFGTWQILAGIWLRRLLGSHLGRAYDGIISTIDQQDLHHSRA